MEVFKIAKSTLNETIVINIVRKDYDKQFQKEINKKMPVATIKGFKKGKAPREAVEDQYGIEIKIEVINEIVQEQLDKFLASENLDLLGTPIYQENPDFDWNNNTLVFLYEIGLAPRFELNLDGLELTKYIVVADDKMIDSQIKNIQQKEGQTITVDQITADATFEIDIDNEEHDIYASQAYTLPYFEKQETQNLFLDKKVGDVLTINASDIAEDDLVLSHFLGCEIDDIADFKNIDLTITIKSITKITPHELNQDLFDKIFGKATVTTIEEFRSKIANDAANFMNNTAEQKLLDQVIQKVVETNNFELPNEFLIRWLHTTSSRNYTLEQATAEYHRTLPGIRYQLIESKAINLLTERLTFQDLKEHTANKVKDQMAQYGYNATDAEIETIVAKSLSKEDEIRQISNEVVKVKALELIKSKATITEKQVTADEFINQFYMI